MPRWELLVSATGVQQQVMALDLASAQSLFSMTLAVMVAGQTYVIESIAANEAFGEIYLYRLCCAKRGNRRCEAAVTVPSSQFAELRISMQLSSDIVRL